VSDASAPYGIMAEFETDLALLEAARRARTEGYARIGAYAPFSVPGLPETLGLRPDRVPLVTLCGGILGGAGAYLLQWYTAVLAYPIDSGGRPLHSWAAFIPATFEMTVLGAALAAFFGMVFLNGLPKLIHPVFDAPDFGLASRNRFFLCIEAADPAFDLGGTHRFLESLGALNVAAIDSAAKAAGH